MPLSVHPAVSVVCISVSAQVRNRVDVATVRYQPCVKMSGGIGDTREIAVTSDDNEEDSEGEEDPHQHALRALRQVPAGSVLVEDSSEVYVGPRLTYNGPVTVNQIVQVTGGPAGYDEVNTQRRLLRQAIPAPGNYADPHSGNTNVNLLNCDVGANRNAVLGDLTEVSSYQEATTCPKNSVVMRLLWVLMGVISFISVCVAITSLIQRNQYVEPKSVSITRAIQTNESVGIGLDSISLPGGLDPIRLQGGYYIFSKRDWRGLDAISQRQLIHPTPVVIISHTVSQQCNTFDRCSQILRGIQTAHMRGRGARTGAEIVDIGYNFLIGGDGNVYEGRGWDVTSFHKKPEGVLGISFIGDYDKYELTQEQIEATQELLEFGVKLEKLSPSYLLIAHSQTHYTNSPGKNVIKVIETWPHWSPTFRIT